VFVKVQVALAELRQFEKRKLKTKMQAKELLGKAKLLSEMRAL
jgi:hypothetical protein